MELGAFVALWPTLVVFGLAGAKLPEVLCCFGDDISEELKCYSA
jgi:hypothetical protein